ncbi:tannase/feruloyl esterase family alpha/beta hydrolase [Azohydromonas caseinilytica]|uniref:Tannase/feruloyl esterase family alpha/beta hydrolase n=1 Tax=Azohydromonas caseinilytica TaxID=2728836 RepID=A0A848FE01_9BURK|nr:tannase/feruloyl esterase family alpha/beta hydrolase [Azohydromonas caseinilytica]NML16380.1 tannase/feruloyl esterase family alpha/beta hydrolase [Azohydromonas caseinilytica]
MRFTSAPSLSLGVGALALLSLAACGGGDDAPPRLAAATPASLGGTCEALAAKLAGQADTRIESVTTEAAGKLMQGGQPVAEHCLVKGRMFERTSAVDGNTYAIGFEMRLPKAWNGRFYHQGNGGIDGMVQPARGALGGGPLTGALQQGFAVISSDAGHAQADGPYFGLDPQARLDYGYQAVGKLTPMAKETIRRAYGKAPDRSYFGGCSNGGRHAFIAATRYADQYDGILAGAPGFNLPKAAVANIWGAQRYATVATGDVTTAAGLETAFNADERRLVSRAVLAKCDALDGARDSLVQDTGACQATFNIATDVPTCTGGRDGSCLSAAQKGVIAAIMAGPRTSAGAPVYASFPWDAGISGSGIAAWEFNASISVDRDAGSVPFIFMSPPQNPVGYDAPAFALNTPIDTLVAAINATSGVYTESAMGFMTPPNPTELGTLKNRGAKMLVYHGVSDPIFSVNDTQAWYDGLRAANGGDASSFAKLYRVPGMGHCSGGPATDQFDMLAPLVKWVEQGQAPQAVVASARGTGNAGGVNADVPADWAPNRTRPLCPYPQVARYKGSGSLESDQSFSCQ